MKPGDVITWESQASGSWKEKNGIVIAIVPKGEHAMKHITLVENKSHIKFQNISKIDRVLVAVAAGKDNQITHYYCPPLNAVKNYGRIFKESEDK